MTLNDYQHYMNQTATLANVLPGLAVTVRITDVRQAFGRVDVKVTPVSGNGETWVSVNRVTVMGEKS